MSQSDIVRFAIGGAILYFALGGSSPVPSVVPSGPYSGPYAAIHSAAKSMEKKDRENMAQAFAAGGAMVAADKRNLLDNTQEASDYLVGLLTFDYGGLAKPSTKYPGLADAIESEFQKAIGTDIKAMDSSAKQKFIDFLNETGRALQ